MLGKKQLRTVGLQSSKLYLQLFFFFFLKQLQLPKSQGLMSVARAARLSLSLCLSPDGWTDTVTEEGCV